MAKLRKLMTESKYLKREFGEPLPTFNGVMKKHKINKLKEDWWDDLGPDGQAKYLKDNPGSQKAQDAKKDDSDDETQSQIDKADTKEFYKDLHWQRAPSPEETQEMTKDMSDEELDELIANQEKELQKAKEWAQPQPPTFYVDPQAAGHIEGAAGRLAGLQAEKDRRAGKEPAKAEPKAEPSAAEKKEKIQGQIDQLKKEYDSVMQSAREAGAEGDGYTQEQMENTAKEIQADIRKLKEKLSSMGRTGKELSRKEAKQFIRRNKMKISEDIMRKVIRQEIKSIMKEDEESFKQPIPATIERFMKKFIGAMESKNLNRKRKLAILGRVIVALRLEPSEVSKYARLVKREL